jgi:hypothetical protein
MRARLWLGAANLALAWLDHVNGRTETALPTVAAVIGGLLLLTTVIDYASPPPR